MDIAAIISLCGSILTAAAVFYFQRAQNRRDKHVDERARIRQEEAYHTMQMIKATMELSQATASAIRDKKCNGVMTAAMRYCDKVNREFTDFIRKQGAAHIHEK